MTVVNKSVSSTFYCLFDDNTESGNDISQTAPLGYKCVIPDNIAAKDFNPLLSCETRRESHVSGETKYVPS